MNDYYYMIDVIDDLSDALGTDCYLSLYSDGEIIAYSVETGEELRVWQHVEDVFDYLEGGYA